jgi:hypothetical protein
MRIQIVSDLHLDVRPKATFRELLEPSAPILALLGDVAPVQFPHLRPFLEWASERWETVLWIPGWAELFSFGTAPSDMHLAVERMKAMAEPYWNITVLDHDGMVSTDGIYIFGLPFWKLPRDEGHVWHPTLYRYVEAEPTPIDGDLARSLYNADIRWLRERVKPQREPVVILSYLGPATWLQEEGFAGEPDRSVVLPELEELLRQPVVAWLCGHCHESVLYQKSWADATGSKGTVLIATNPKGMLLQNLAYRTDAVIRIDPTLYRA